MEQIFTIDISEDGIAYASFFSMNDGGYHEFEDKALEKTTWQEIAKTAESLAGTLEAIPQKDETEKDNSKDSGNTLSGEEKPLDGGYRSLALTWEKDGEQKRIGYYCRSNDWMRKLLTLLREAVDPKSS